MTRTAPFAYTATNNYHVEVSEYGAAKVTSPDGEHVGGFSGPSRVWSAHHDRRDFTNWSGAHSHFCQKGTRLNVGSAKGEHADAVIAAVREQGEHDPSRKQAPPPTAAEIAKVRDMLAARGIDLDALMAQ